MRYFDEPSEFDPNPRFPFGVCNKNVFNHNKAIKCDSCGYWNHIKCDGVEDKTYQALKKNYQMSKEKKLNTSVKFAWKIISPSKKYLNFSHQL